jgi:cyclic pyranopterin phosphate synthase
LVRKNLMWFISRLSGYVDSGHLDEITLTTNGSQLMKYAEDLAKNNIKRINVSLDTLNEELFSKITRWGNLPKVLDGIKVAQKAGIKIKINTVALKNINDKEIPKIIEWAHNGGMDITVIETMPMGDIDGDRTEHYLPLSGLRSTLEEKYTLNDIPYKTGGPARYVEIKETGGVLGFITPLSHNFCESCNRIRVTCTGTLYMCLGQEDAADLLTPIRQGADDNSIKNVIYEAISRKPKGHDFIIDRKHNKPSISRFMSVTGG